MKDFKRNLMLLGLMLSVSSSAAMADETVTLRFHHFLPGQANVPSHILKPWAEKVEEASENQIRVDFFPAMQLGGTPAQLVDQVRDGVVDIVWTLPGYTPGRFPLTEVFELPFVMTDPVATSRAYAQLMHERIAEEEFSDYHVIGVWVHGPGVIHSRVPVENLDDFVGLKVRSPSRVTNSMFSSLGATPVGMPVPAVPEALSRGVIDAAALPWETTAALRIPELATFHTEFEGNALYTATFVVLMNKERYESMPPHLQAAVDTLSGLEFAEFAAETHYSFDHIVRQQTIERGNTVIAISETDAKNWLNAAEETARNWVSEMDAQDLDGTGFYERAMKLIQENTNQ